MRGGRWVAIASLFGAPACANVWGFANLTAGDAGDDGSADADDASSDASDAGSIPNGCNLAIASSCRDHCMDDASPCGCLADDGMHISYCGYAGSGKSTAPCATGMDCAPGYGCMASTGTCTQWCRPNLTPPCNSGVCNPSPTLKYSGVQYGFCF